MLFSANNFFRTKGNNCGWSMTPPPKMIRWGDRIHKMLYKPNAR